VDAAGVLLVGNGHTHQTLAPTSDLLFTLDELQMTTGEGPCLQAALNEVVVRVNDFRTEPRFPRYGPEVVRLGVSSAWRSSCTRPTALPAHSTCSATNLMCGTAKPKPSAWARRARRGGDPSQPPR
jgi:hypothetical protein